MSRKQFISKLSYHLSALNIEERREIISFYEDRFNNAVYEGKTDEDIISELETPEEIARNVLSEYGIQKRVKEQRVEPTSILGILFFDLFITSWLLPVLVTVTGALTMSWFSYFATFSVFFNFGFGTALAAFILSTAVFAVYLVFILYLIAVVIKLVLFLFTWHVRVFTGNKNINLIDRLESFNLFDELKKIKITHKLLGIIALTGVVVAVASVGIWRTVAKPTELINGTIETHEFEVSDLENYSLSTLLSNAAVDVEYGTSDKVVVTFNNYDEAEITYTELTNGLDIEDKTRYEFWDNVSGMDFIISLLNNDLVFNPSHMTIEVPVGIEFAELEIHTDNGEIDVEGMNATILDISTANGTLSLTGVEADSIKSVTVNGEITFDDVFAGTVFIESVNGEIELNDINTASIDGARLDITLVNGEITVSDAYFKRVDIENVNGNVSYFNTDRSYIAESVQLETVNGKESSNVGY